MGRHRPRQPGFHLSVYFKDVEEARVASAEEAIKEQDLLWASGHPFRSFSELVRQALFEKLQRRGR